MDREQQLMHDRADRLELLEATGFDQVAVESPDGERRSERAYRGPYADSGYPQRGI